MFADRLCSHQFFMPINDHTYFEAIYDIEDCSLHGKVIRTQW